VVILEVSKLQDGRLVKAPLLLLKFQKKTLPTVMILEVSKLQDGRLVKAPLLLKALKNQPPTLADPLPK